MSGLFWKLALVLIVALLVAATTLASLARSQAEPQPIPAAVARLLPPDGLAKAKRAAAHAAEAAALRAAIHQFNFAEGRPPDTLAELAQSRYLEYARTKPDLRRFRYDPVTMTVSDEAR